LFVSEHAARLIASAELDDTDPLDRFSRRFVLERNFDDGGAGYGPDDAGLDGAAKWASLALFVLFFVGHETKDFGFGFPLAAADVIGLGAKGFDNRTPHGPDKVAGRFDGWFDCKHLRSEDKGAVRDDDDATAGPRHVVDVDSGGLLVFDTGRQTGGA